MDKEYIVSWGEMSKTKTGKAVFNATLEGEDGKISIWSDFPDFANIRPGSKVFGSIVTNEKGYKSLYPPRTGTSGAYNSNKGGIKAAQERKAEMIEKAQDRKSDSIAYFNSLNSAIAMFGQHTALIPSKENCELLITWRDWFIEEYHKYQEKDITDKQNPF